MSPEAKDWIDLISKVVIAVAAIYGAWKSKQNSGAIEGVKNDVEVVRTDVNDKMQQFIKVTGDAEHAKGVIEGHKAGSIESKGTSDDPIHVKVSDVKE